MEHDILAELVAGERLHESQVDARQLIGIGRPVLRRAEGRPGGPSPGGSRAGERAAGHGKSLAASAANADQPARPVAVKVAADVVQIEVLQLHAIVGNLLPGLDAAVLDEDAVAADQPFHRGGCCCCRYPRS